MNCLRLSLPDGLLIVLTSLQLNLLGLAGLPDDAGVARQPEISYRQLDPFNLA